MLRTLIAATVIVATLRPVLGSPLTEAAAADKLKEVKRLLKAGAAVNELDSDGHFALHLAIFKGHADVAHYLLEEASDLDLNTQETEHGRTALMTAARYGQPKLGLELVRKGAALDLQDHHGWTALMYATLRDQPKLGRELVRKGAALDVQNHNGWTALMLAAFNAQPELGQELLQRGADFRKRTYRAGASALHVCGQEGKVDLAEAILDLGEDVDSRDASGRTALWWASHYGKEPMARALLQRGANAAIPASWGQTPEAVADSPKLKHLLHRQMPGELDLAFRLACSPDTWLHMGLGLLVGVAGAISNHFSNYCGTRGSYSRLPGEEDEDQPSKGAMKLARQAFAKRSKLRYYAALAHHAGTTISAVVLPLGVFMLFFKTAVCLPLYALVCLIAAVLCTGCRQFVTNPVLVLTGGSARGFARAVQAIATLAVLVGVEAVQQECIDDIEYYIDGDLTHTTPGKLAHFMVDWGRFSLINAAAAPLPCKGSSLDPFAATTRAGFDAYLFAVKMASLLWALSALVEAWSCKNFGAASPEDREDVVSLAVQISGTRSAGEVECLQCDVAGVKVAPERRERIYFTVFMSLLDVFMDWVTIFNLVATYNTKFAGALTAITVMASCSEILSGNLRRLPGDLQETVNRGVMPDGLVDFLSVEKGLEAPLALAVTVYAFPFSVRGWRQLCTGLLSMALSIYSCAQYRIGMEGKQEAADTDSEETSSLITSSSSSE